MSVTPRAPAIDPVLREQAADWHVRLASDAASDADWLAFEAWLAASPEHLRAYEDVETLWSELDASAPSFTHQVVVPMRRAPSKARMSGWIAAVAAGLALTVGLGVAARLMVPRTEVHETARGQREAVRLADGSRLTLNGDTRLTVQLGRRERDVVLTRGEAVFDVAKDAARPFQIAVGDRQVRVVGTEFNILRHAGAVVVTVRRGVVEVSPTGGTAAPIARLKAGDSLSHQEGREADQVREADPAIAFAWTEGRLIFRNERLENVAKVLNRYVETPLMVANDVRDVRVTAVLALDREDTMVGVLAEFLPIKARREPGAVWIESR